MSIVVVLIFALNTDKNNVNTKINASKVNWSRWFCQGKAFATVDNRSYAQVLKGNLVDNNTKLVENHQTRKCNSKVDISVNRRLGNNVVNDIIIKPQ